MKKLFVFLIAAALVFSLAACAGSGTDAKADGGSGVTTEAATQAEEATEADIAEPEEPEETEADYDAMIEAGREQLIGSWTYDGVDDERLTFSEDGTGSYKGIFDKDCTFTYTVSLFRDSYANGREYAVLLLSVAYSTGESEDITFEFRDEPAEKMVFHNSDYTSGYSGVINFDEYVRA